MHTKQTINFKNSVKDRIIFHVDHKFTEHVYVSILP